MREKRQIQRKESKIQEQERIEKREEKEGLDDVEPLVVAVLGGTTIPIARTMAVWMDIDWNF